MLDSVASFLEILLTLILFLILSGFFGSYLYIRNLRRECRDGLRLSGRLFRELEFRLRSLHHQTEIFSKDDPEPYGEMAAELAAWIVQVEITLKSLQAQYADQQSYYKNISRLPFYLWLVHMLDWVKFRTDIDQYQSAIEQLNVVCDEIESLGDRLQNVSGEIAIQCKQLLEKAQWAIDELGEIRKQGYGDNILLQTELALKEWETTLLNQIPVSFLSPDLSGVHDQAEKKVVSRVYRLLHTSGPQIDHHHNTVSGWKNLIQQVLITQKNLSLRGKAIAQIMSSLEKTTDQSVVWDQSQRIVDSQDMELIHVQEKALALSNLEVVHTELLDLEKRQILLKKEVEQTLKIYRELIRLRGEFDTTKVTAWTKNALSKIEVAKKFNILNWKNISDVARLTNNLQNLLQQLEVENSQRGISRIAESDIALLHKRISSVHSMYEKYLPIYEVFWTKLRDIQEKVKKSKDILTRDYAALNQARGIISSNQFLSKLAANESEKLILAIVKLNAELDVPEQGLVDDKCNRVDQIHKKISDACQKWLQKLRLDISGKKEELSQTVNVLQDLVSLSDPVFAEVVTLLQEQRQGENSSQVVAERNETLSLTKEIKTQSEVWQKVIASQKAISDIAGPVLDRFRKMEKNRMILQEIMSKADGIVPEMLSWPPHTQRLTTERMKYQNLESKYHSFKSERHKAIQLMGLISDLSDGYQELNSNVSQIIERAKQEQERFLDLDKRFNQSKQMWHRLAKGDKSTVISIDEINQLIMGADSDYTELQKRYRSGGLPYQQAYQMFRIICRKLDEATVELGMGQLMDINGVIQKRL
jgi:hypothetical protein